MSSSEGAELRLSVPRDEAIKAIIDALPKDAIVRGHDDGIGRFAGERTVVIVGRGDSKLLMFQGTWGSIKGRLEEPHLEVALEGGDGGAKVRLRSQPAAKRGIVSYVTEVLGQIVTVGAVLFAYHKVRDLPIDWTRVALLSVGVGIAWSVVAYFLPTKEDRGLMGLCRDALEPLQASEQEGDDDDEAEDRPSA